MAPFASVFVVAGCVRAATLETELPAWLVLRQLRAWPDWKALPMAYAKTSERREKRLLREQMRSMGLGYRDIAAEFARRYRLRPRAAWREAYGWSLQDTADRINDIPRAHRPGPRRDRRDDRPAPVGVRELARPPAPSRPAVGPPPTCWPYSPPSTTAPSPT